MATGSPGNSTAKHHNFSITIRKRTYSSIVKLIRDGKQPKLGCFII